MTIITKPKNTLAIIVDQLGAIKAQIASLEEAESALKARLVASGQTEIDGTLFRATVRQSERWTLDRKLVEKDMGEDFVTAHSKIAHMTSVYVVSR